MTDRPVILREHAERDIEVSLAQYVGESGEKTALGFVDALKSVFGHISRYSASGSPRYSHELEIPDLRFRSLKRYPYLVFYVEREDRINVWRILHEVHDMPGWLQEPESD